MKLTHLKITHYLGARSIDAALAHPITLFAGRNGAGKSSIVEAVRHAITGASTRVTLKKDYGHLITEGQEVGSVEVQDTLDGSFSVVLPSGKGVHHAHPALPYVLDHHAFSRMEPNDRRAFLFNLMKIKTDGAEVLDRLIKRGCDVDKAKAIAPHLSAGFDAAAKEAQAQAREQKALWRNITGEAYGDKKAPGWKAAAPEISHLDLVAQQSVIDGITKMIDAANQELGALNAQDRAAFIIRHMLVKAQEDAGKYARIADKLQRDEKELAEWKAKVEDTRAKAAGGVVEAHHECPHCEGLIQIRNAMIVKYVIPEKVPDAEAAARLPEYEKAMRTLENAVANDKRDLALADQAAKSIEELEKQIGEAPAEMELMAAVAKVDELKAERKRASEDMETARRLQRQHEEAANKTASAQVHHNNVQAWGQIADALAPDGIPGELLIEALEPVQVRMDTSKRPKGWPLVFINEDMSIVALGPDDSERPYSLLSESEQWRVDAVIAEAISYLSGLRLLALDRADLLDMAGRTDLLYWLDDLAEAGEIDTALVFATLKAVPTGLPDNIRGIWVESGVADDVAAETQLEAA